MSRITTTRILHTSANRNIAVSQRSWVWPVPRLDGIAPHILEPAASHAALDGVVIGYPGRSFSPNLVPVFAAQDGVVTYAGTTATGSTLCIDHEGGWSTHYSELEHLLTRPTDRFRRRRRERIRGGDVIGHVRRSTLQMRFALWQLNGDECTVQDPTAHMLGWLLLPWFDTCPKVRSLRPTG
jgi:hypothetical protein